MNTELSALALAALLGYLLIAVEIVGKTRLLGTAWNAGNRDESPPLPAWIERTGRAIRNHQENFLLFMPAVVIVHLAGRTSAMTATASIVYVVARAAHAAFYVGGITRVRSLAYVVGLGATMALYARLLPIG